MNAAWQWLTSQRGRAYLYRVLLAVLAVLGTVYGVVTGADAVQWALLGASVLGVGTATANTSTRE